MTGAVCYPTCIVALSDPVVLANGSSADTVEHWMLPSKVQVRWSGRFATLIFDIIGCSCSLTKLQVQDLKHTLYALFVLDIN